MEKTEKISVVKCQNYDYDYDKVYLAVKQAVDIIGGMESFVKKGQRVALKVNLLMKVTPEKCATTHPAVAYAVAKLVLEAGATPFIIDSAGGPFTSGYINAIYKSSGMQEVADKLGIETNQDFGSVDVSHPEAKVGLKFPYLKALAECDAIINLSKLKTHSFTGYTNCIKNMFGVIPGLAKVEMHGKYRSLNQFANFIFDIHSFIGDKLVLNITDAVMGMEGDGPSNGEPREIGVILAGKSAICSDVVACQIIGINPSATPFIRVGIERGFATSDFSEIEVVGEKIEDVFVPNFKNVVPDEYKPYANYVPRFLQNTVHRLMTKRPVISKRKCKGCKKCYDHCPAKAIEMVGKDGQVKKAEIDYNKCIRCYCCQELCPFGVVKVKAGIIYKLTHRGR